MQLLLSSTSSTDAIRMPTILLMLAITTLSSSVQAQWSAVEFFSHVFPALAHRNQAGMVTLPRDVSVTAAGRRSSIRLQWARANDSQSTNQSTGSGHVALSPYDEAVVRFSSGYVSDLDRAGDVIARNTTFDYFCLRQGRVSLTFYDVGTGTELPVEPTTSSTAANKTLEQPRRLEWTHQVMCVIQQSLLKDAFVYVLLSVEFLTLLILGLSVRRRAVLEALRQPLALLAAIILITICLPLV